MSVQKIVGSLTYYDTKVEVLLDTETGHFSHVIHHLGATRPGMRYQGTCDALELFNDISKLTQKAGVDIR